MKTMALWLALGSVLLLWACGPGTPRSVSGKPIIGFSQDSLVIERWKRDIEAFQAAANSRGAQVLVKVANQDVSIQEEQIKDLVRQGASVLVVVANDADRLSAVIRQVRSQGVRVISYDRLIRKAGVDLYISFDNEKVGSLMTSAVLSKVTKGGVVIINGARNDNNALMINKGIRSVLNPYLAAGAIHLVSEFWPETWDNTEVGTYLEGVVPQVDNIRGVVAGDDMLAEEAIRFFSENGRARLVQVVGQDADLAACQRIAEGTQLATIYKPVKALATEAAAYAVAMALGQPIHTEETLDDGAGKVPYVRLDPILLTRANLDLVIQDKFHTAAEVYKNLKPAK